MNRKLQQHNLMEEYRVPDLDVRRYFQMMGSIAFVPEEDVPTAWRFLKPLLPVDMTEFGDYFESTWIGTSSRNPTFAHYKWNLHDSTKMLLPRSSNIAEGWHHGFHSMIPCSHPAIWKFLDCLKSEQDLTDVKLTKRLCREAPERRAAKWIKYDSRPLLTHTRTMTCLIFLKLLAVWFESKFIILYYMLYMWF